MKECKLVRSINGYKIVNPSGVDMTPIFYFNNDREAWDWAYNYLTSYGDFSLTKGVYPEGL